MGMMSDWQIVPMGDVPGDAPAQKRAGKYASIVTAMLGLKPTEAIRVSTNGMKHLAMFRNQLRKVAKRSTSRVVNAKRDADGKNLWVWLDPVYATRVTITYPDGSRSEQPVMPPVDTIYQAVR